MDVLRNALKAYDLAFLNPALRTDDLSSQTSVFGRDMLMVYSSDIESLSDYLADSLHDAATWIENYLQGSTIAIKGAEFIHQAMELYRHTQYAHDLPMQHLVENSEALKHRILRATGPRTR